jgi:spore coat protein U-like protein
MPLALLLSTMFFQTAAQAAINCTISSPGFIAAYSGTASSNQTSFTVTCTRLGADPSTQTYSAVPNNGLHNQGVNNRAKSNTNFIRYDEFQNSGCTTTWKSNAPISGTVNFGTNLTATDTKSYWGCIASGLTPTAGTYTDTVIMTLTYGSSTATNSHPVTIITPAVCNITSAPGNVAFSYTAFQGVTAAANTSFGVTCSTSLPYTMSLDANGGVVSGLNYSLNINTLVPPVNSTGTGSAQTHTINGSMPAGQAGTCATGTCAGTQAHTLTITY